MLIFSKLFFLKWFLRITTPSRHCWMKYHDFKMVAFLMGPKEILSNFPAIFVFGIAADIKWELYHQWLHDSAHQIVTNSTCVVCHNLSHHPQCVMPTKEIHECTNPLYNSLHLFPAICLLGSAVCTHGADWMWTSCTYHPSSTKQYQICTQIKCSLDVYALTYPSM